jgi:hypothetical protein
MDLVTITCNRDLKIMLLQAKSVEKFLKPGTTCWVFINEPADTLFKIDWEGILRPYYSKHRLKIVHCDPMYWTKVHNGWVLQQMHKLLAVKFVNKNYLLLDSKNFFVADTDISTFTHDGCGILISEEINNDVWQAWDRTNSKYSTELNYKKLSTYYAAETPYVIKQDIAKRAVNRENFENWFIKCFKETQTASEFIYYSYFLEMAGHIFTYNRMHHSLWPENKDIEEWFVSDDFPTMQISGIHRGWLEQADADAKHRVKLWLDSLGLIDDQTTQNFN